MEQKTRNTLEAIRFVMEKNPLEPQAYRDLYQMIRELPEEEKRERHEWSQYLITASAKALQKQTDPYLMEQYYEVWKGALKLDSKDCLDSYLLFLESGRLPEERFYQPRRRILKNAVDIIQDLIDGKLDEAFIAMPPRVGKTSLCMFVYTWLIGKNSETSNLYVAFSDVITSAFYSGVLEVLNDPYTYKWKEVFPDSKIVHTNSKEETINIDRNKRYPSLTCRSLYGTLNGACDCSGLLMSDDLIGGIEEALNPNRLQNAWSKVDNNMLTRAKGLAKILWVGTRWSIADPAGRRIDLLENDPKFADRRYKVLNLPALNEKDESNFDYDYGVGFSTAFYHQRRASFEHNNDMASWYAQYQQQPIEREGALFTPETTRMYNGILPEEAVTKVFMAVDPAFGGGDFVAGPVCVKTESGDIYVEDVIYDDADKKETIPKLARLVIRHGVRHIQFAVNKMTMSYREEFERELKRQNPAAKVTITTKADPNQSSKEQRIFEAAPDIRDTMVFLEPSRRTKEYNMFMQNVFGFTVLGKNRHDDAPDSLAMAIDMDLHPSGIYRIMRREF